MASKLHGVEVDIKMIKRKGDPIISTPDAENNCKYFDAQPGETTRNCTPGKYDTNINNNINNNNNNNTQVPSKDSLCGKSKAGEND